MANMKITKKVMKAVALLSIFSTTNGEKAGNLRQEKDTSALEWFVTHLEEERFLEVHHTYSVPSASPEKSHPSSDDCSCPDDVDFSTPIGGIQVSCLYVLFSFGLPTFDSLCETKVDYNGCNLAIKHICQEACCKDTCTVFGIDGTPTDPDLCPPDTQPPTPDMVTDPPSAPPTAACECPNCEPPETASEKEARLRADYAAQSPINPATDPSTYYNDDRDRAFAFVHPDISDSCDREQADIQRFVAALWYYSTVGSAWTETGNYLSADVDECEWFGITCNNDQGEFGGRIIEMKHNGNGLTGTLAWEISWLSKLEIFEADDSAIGGPIHDSYTDLAVLRIINLDSNQLTGTIPKRIGKLKMLEVWDTDSNKLTGSIPTTMNNLPKIRVIDLDTNQLTGDLKKKFGQLNTLEQLQLQNNKLTGTIPISIGNLISADVLYFHDNDFTGTMPDEVCQLSATDLISDCAGVNPEVVCNCCSQCQ